MNTPLRTVVTALVLCAVAAIGLFVFVMSGTYNIGADVPHTRPVLALMQTLRERSIRAHAGGIVVPARDDEQLILTGAGQ